MRGRVLAIVIALILSATTAISLNSHSHAADPQGTFCGVYNLNKNEVIARVKFPKGSYQIYSYSIACNKVLGSKGFFNTFLKQKDKDPLPKPWKFLSSAVGAGGFMSGPGVGFRVQIVSSPTPTPTVFKGNTYLALATKKTPTTKLTLSTTNKTLTIKSGNAVAITVPSIPKGTTVLTTMRTPDGKTARVSSTKTGKSGNYAVPSLQLKKPGTYTLQIKYAKVTRTVRVTVKSNACWAGNC